MKPSMWTILRKRVIWILVLLLVPSFVLFYHSNRQDSQSGPGGAAGKLFGKTIAWETFQDQQRWTRTQLQGQFGELNEAVQPLVESFTWDKLILVEEAQRQRLKVDNRELARYIQEIPAFQQEGRFIPQRYHQYVRMNGMSPQTFESLLRNDLLTQKLVTEIRSAVTVTDEDVKKAYIEENERLKATLFVINPAEFASQAQAQVTPEALRALYEENKAGHRIPEDVVLEYVSVFAADLRPSIELSEEELRDFYDTHPEAFTDDQGGAKPYEEVADAVREQALDEEASRRLKELAADLAADRAAGWRLEEMIQTRSLTLRTSPPVPVNNPWQAGFQPDWVSATANLAEGELSEVVENPQSVFIGRLLSRTPSRIPEFEEVQDNVRAQFTQKQTRTLAQARARQLRTHLMEKQAAGMRIEEVVATETIPMTEAEFGRKDPVSELGAVPALNDAAFALKSGELSEVIETPTAFVIIRPQERIAPDLSSLAQNQETLRKQLLEQQQTQKLTEWMEELRQKAALESFVKETS